MSDQIPMFPPPEQDPAGAAAPPSDTASDTSDTASDSSDNRVSVRLDQEAAANLAALLVAAGNQTNAIRYALRIAASVAQGAWGMGLVPPNQLPEAIAHRVTVPGRAPVDVHLPRPQQAAPYGYQPYPGPRYALPPAPAGGYPVPYPGPLQYPHYPQGGHRV